MHVRSQTWVSNDVELRDSLIDGRGLFARVNIRLGIALVRFGGRLVSTVELTSLMESSAAAGSYVDTIAVDSDLHLVLAADSISRFGNHSCDPTLWLSGSTELVTRRQVQAGDELTTDYATFSPLPDYTLTCCCGSAMCRGKVTGNDWKLVALQERYAGHWSVAASTLIDGLP